MIVNGIRIIEAEELRKVVEEHLPSIAHETKIRALRRPGSYEVLVDLLEFSNEAARASTPIEASKIARTIADRFEADGVYLAFEAKMTLGCSFNFLFEQV